MVTMEVVDETLAGKEIGVFRIEVGSAELTVQQLIELRVRHEVEQYNASAVKVRNGMLMPTKLESRLNGYGEALENKVDAEKQVYRVLEAFKKNGFFVLVGDQQVEELNQIVEVKESSRVVFVQLTPLVGG